MNFPRRFLAQSKSGQQRGPVVTPAWAMRGKLRRQARRRSREARTKFAHHSSICLKHSQSFEKVADDDSHHLVPIHEHHRLVLLNNVMQLGLVKDVIKVGVGAALVFGFDFTKSQFGELVNRVVSLEDLGFGEGDKWTRGVASGVAQP
jgi:hypothetical protein